MKKWIVAYLFLLVSGGANAQYIIDLSTLDYIGTDEERVEGYSRNGNGYILHAYDRYDAKADSVIISRTEEDSVYGDVIKVADIPAMSIADWEELLDKNDIILGESKQNESDLLIKKSPYYMLGVSLWYSEETAGYKDDKGALEYSSISIGKHKYNVLDCTDQYSINYIKLKGDKYLLCLISDSGIYKFMPHKGKQGSKIHVGKLEKELEKNRIEMYSGMREFAYFDIEQSGDGRYYIVNDEDMPIGIKGDTIISHQGAVAVYSKAENRYDLYDPFLNKVEHNYDIRYVKAGKGGDLILLVGNKLKQMAGNNIGENIDVFIRSYMVCGTVSRYIDDIKYVDGKIKLEKTKDHQMVANGVEYFSYDITNAQDIDSLYFGGMKVQQRYSANDYPFFQNVGRGSVTKEKLLYAKKKNGKYNLYTYTEISSELYKQTEATTTGFADIERGYGEPAKRYSKGEIELVRLLADDADSITLNSYPIIYTQNGLKGIYSINPKARYSVLRNSYAGGLMRYELPDGTQGWLDLDNGKEVEDI